MIKLISLIYRKKGISEREFYSYWLEQHGPLAARMIPFAKRYVQGHPLAISSISQEADGVVELWFETVGDFERYLQWRDTPEAQELKQDEDRFLDFKKTRRIVVTEHEIEPAGRPWIPGASLPDGPG